MHFRTRPRFGFGLAVVALVLVACGQAAHGQAKEKQKKGKVASKEVTIPTYDGVDLSGTFYPNPAGKKDATVLLLHNFDKKKGGGSHMDKWDDLAERLHKEGYSVLQFDFRGFGRSKTVSEKFWDRRKFPQNNGAARGRVDPRNPPTSIDSKYFAPGYFPYLVNDVAAAKAYLDRRNDAGEVNTSSFVLIGAGEGATLGAMWLNWETFRRRDKNRPNGLVVAAPNLAEPEIADVAGAIWLSISPTLDGRMLPSNKLRQWVVNVGRTHKVPMAFVYSKGDARGQNLALSLEKAIKGNSKGKEEFSLTGCEGLKAGALSGSALLRKALGTEDWIVDTYLDKVMEKRGNKERVERNATKHRCYYVVPKTKQQTLLKEAGEEVSKVDVGRLMQGR
jgi:alpha-beta hydrolase superfamily lysophospholipase